MSHKATSYVFELTEFPDGTPLTRDDKIVLFVLADHHNYSTNEAFPSVERMARLAIMSERHLRDILRRAEQHGLIETSLGGGRGKRSSYRFKTLPEKGGVACLVLEGEKAALSMPGFEAEKGAPCLPGIEIVNPAKTRHKGGTAAHDNKEEPGTIEPNTNTASKRKRKTRDEIFVPFSEDVKNVVNTILTDWPTVRQGDKSKIETDLPLLATRIDQLLKNPDITAYLLISAARRYLVERRSFPHAPQFFFGPGKNGEAPWKAYARMEWHEQQQKAAATAAGIVQ